MNTNSELEQIVEQNLNIAVELYNEMTFSKNSLQKFTAQFGNVDNSFDFIHGYFMGELQGIAFSISRFVLNRNMNEEERDIVAKLVKNKIDKVENTVKRIKELAAIKC